jgi:hypothetical protein
LAQDIFERALVGVLATDEKRRFASCEVLGAHCVRQKGILRHVDRQLQAELAGLERDRCDCRTVARRKYIEPRFDIRRRLQCEA